MLRNRKDTRLIFIHCAATASRQDIGVQTIHKWHLERGMFSERGLSGYHFVIRRSGLIELGRDLPSIGAHAVGFNEHSASICLVGGVDKDPKTGELVPKNNFTDAQWFSLEVLVRALKLIYPDAALAPHNLVSAKACPSFDVYAWQMEKFGYSDELRARKAIAEIKDED